MGSTGSSAEFENARCRRRLRAYVRQIDALLDLLGDALVLFHPERGRAEAMYRNLKNGLRHELRTGRPRGAPGRGTPLRAEVFDPCLRAALSRLRWPVHSIPGRRWVATLADARLDLELGLERVERRLRTLRDRRDPTTNRVD